MAQASIQHQPTTRTHRSPDPARVFQTYQAERQAGGEWGAYTRTAARYRKPDGSPYSDEWARKTIKKHLAAVQSPTPVEAPPAIDNELQYVPPPGGYPEPEPALHANSTILCELDEREQPTDVGELPTDATAIMESAPATAANSQPGDLANSQLIERETTPALPTVHRVIVRVPVEARPAGLLGWFREHEAARQQAIAVAVFLVLVLLTWLG